MIHDLKGINSNQHLVSERKRSQVLCLYLNKAHKCSSHKWRMDYFNVIFSLRLDEWHLAPHCVMKLNRVHNIPPMDWLCMEMVHCTMCIVYSFNCGPIMTLNQSNFPLWELIEFCPTSFLTKRRHQRGILWPNKIPIWRRQFGTSSMYGINREEYSNKMVYNNLSLFVL